MKKNFKLFAMMAVALLTGLSSCSNNDMDEVVTGDSKSVFIKLTNETPASRAASDAQGETEIVLKKGTVYFANAIGIIKKQATFGDNGEVSLAQIKAGHKFENIDGSVSKVYVVGNTDVTATGNIAAVKAQALDLASQKNIANVNLWGESGLTLVTPAAGAVRAVYQATVNLSATVARVELTDITATGDVITGFTVDAIFVDDYFQASNIEGVPSRMKDRAQDNTKYVAGKGFYTPELLSIIYDKLDRKSDNNVVKTQSDKDVWAYNIFAPKSDKGYTPRLIIRLKDIETATDAATISSPQFITVKGFLENEARADINAGKVYNIAAGQLVFDETTLTPEPNTEAIDVIVTVTVPTWKVVPVKPEL